MLFQNAERNNFYSSFFTTSKKTFEANVFHEQSGKLDKSSKIVSVSLYAEHLRQYYHFFPSANIHIVDGDKLIKENPYFELAKIEKFLGISAAITKDDFVVDEEKGFYCMTEYGCLDENKGRPHPYIAHESIAKLKEFMKPLNEEFFELIGRRFPWNDE